MKLSAKAKAKFKGFSPEPISHPARLGHLFADYAELLTVCRNGDWLSRADLIKRFETFELSVPRLSSTVAGRPTMAELTAAEEDDAFDAWAQRVYSNLETRKALFGPDYPFELSSSSLRLRAPLGPKQKLYLMLLMCANLPYFEEFVSVLTADFEQVAFEALRTFLPAHACVKQLGKNSDYRGTAQEKIAALADEMQVCIDEHEVGKIEGNQERGLDIVGWVPFDDRYANLLCVMGQCACGKNWSSKLSETRRFEFSYLRFKRFNPIHAMFVPRGFFHNGDFFESDEIAGSMIFDRGRIMQLIQRESLIDSLASKEIVEACIAGIEGVV